MAGPPLGPTSAPSFEDTLKKQLTERPALAEVSICVGPPPSGIAQLAQWIAILGYEGTQRWPVMGRLQKEENYYQEILISVLTHDGDADSVTGRNIAHNLMQEVANQLIQDPTVGGTVWQCQIQRNIKGTPRLGVAVAGPNGEQTVDMSWREYELRFDILVKNRM